jgi:hypothetical protein
MDLVVDELAGRVEFGACLSINEVDVGALDCGSANNAGYRETVGQRSRGKTSNEPQLAYSWFG